MKAIRLRTEYLKDPLGIDIERPRLMWNAEGGRNQTAYRIVTPKWDSGKVESASMRAVYPLVYGDRERVDWKVCLWDENGEPGEWSESYFEAGITYWQAKWITGDYPVKKTMPVRRVFQDYLLGGKRRYPVDCFRRVFEVTGDVAKARLYITACGLYEARIGGEKAGNFCMAPGHTDYRKRIQYQTYDVAGLLVPGKNELTVQLADGWYRGSCGAWGLTDQYGTETKLLAQLEITCADGTRQTVCTDGTWEWSCDGPLRFADNKDGETVEAFRTPQYDGRAKETSCKVVPTASDNVFVTEHERFRPVVTTAPNGRKLLDFGQNLAGWIEFTVQAHIGQRMVWRCGEMLDAEGNLTLANIQCANGNRRTPLQQIDYTCGEGENHYKTTFAVFGFRYAEVETDVELDPEKIAAVAVYSDMEETGTFTSSNGLLDRFVEATKWSTKSNSLDVPTDCPTRERHGWTGDAQIFFTTAAYLFDYAPFARKYLRDLYDWQKKDGKLPQIAPAGGVDFFMDTMNGSVGWADAGVLIPYRFRKIYDDRQILEAYYEGMKKYARFMMRRCGKNSLLSEKVRVSGPAGRYLVNAGQSYGEWAEPADVHPNDWKDMAAPHPEVSTAYSAYVLRVMADIAKELGKTEDEKEFRHAAAGCRAAYRALSETPQYSLDTDRQARLVRPLAFGLLTKEQKAFAEKRLTEALEHYGWRLGTGFLSTPLILDVLAKTDIEAAYRLLENEEMPGWLFMPRCGATTVWESWEGTEAQGGIASLNHYSKGAVCEWLFSTMCGIRPDGENRFVIAPRPGGHFTHAEASYRSVYGEVRSGWKRENGKTVYTIHIPANCTAVVRLPGHAPFTAGAGTHTRGGL